MKRKCTITMAVMSLVVLLGACATADRTTQANSVKEFSFPGGEFKDGKFNVSRDFEVQKDPKSKKIFLKRAAGGPGLEFDCSCILEAGGFCFPIAQDDGSGPIILLCGSSGCGSGEEPFCLQELGEQGGFRFQAIVASTRAASQ
jgi:hypothetical protein